MTFSLTLEQIQVVESRAPRLLINAVPGAGKSSTLQACVSHLLNHGASPTSILILTFSNRTRDELRTRINNPKVLVSTFHGYANRIVRESSDQRLTVANSGQLAIALRQTVAHNSCLVRRFRKHGIDLAGKAEQRRILHFLISSHGDPDLEQRLLSDRESSVSHYGPALIEIRQLARRFNRRLRDHGLTTYAQMLSLGQAQADQHRSEIKHVLVDEYQDMDLAQAKLLVAICKNVETLRIFGDPGQAIYSFMGSQVSDLATLLSAHTTTLSESHRLTRQTAEFASSLLNSISIVGSRDGARPVLKQCKSQRDQEQYLVNKIRSLNSKGIPPGRIAILSRTRIELRIIERVLRAQDIAVTPMHRETQRHHLLVMLELLRLVNANREELRDHLSRSRNRDLEAGISNTVGVVPPHHQASLRRAAIAAAKAGSLEGRFSAVKRAYLSMLTKSGLGESRTSVEHELNLWQPLIRKFSTVRSFTAFVERQYDQLGVILSTIHSAKGKEWDHVVLINVTDGVIPHVREIQKQNVEEERRLLYVAATRARSHLHLVQAPVFRGTLRFSKRTEFLNDRTLRNLDQL
ncbi:ATP-dependent helicase [Pandoraea sputorum]|uniref:UvrD-helicase domain-containing protein n=1 Tax=Pandoraea sputorum TaxID=93222 RepID=UPI001E485671|nr:ATP-dependent helicase [Pandoraea sputorum]MCE4062698.1 ATP-dependent helicase [Pandoraea sputorum]